MGAASCSALRATRNAHQPRGAQVRLVGGADYNETLAVQRVQHAPPAPGAAAEDSAELTSEDLDWVASGGLRLRDRVRALGREGRVDQLLRDGRVVVNF